MLTAKLIIISMLISFLSAQYILKGEDPNGIKPFVGITKNQETLKFPYQKCVTFYIDRFGDTVGLCHKDLNYKSLDIINMLSNTNKGLIYVHKSRKLDHFSKYKSDFIVYFDDHVKALAILKNEKELKYIDVNEFILYFNFFNGKIFLTTQVKTYVYEISEDFTISQIFSFTNPITFSNYSYYNFEGNDYFYQTEYFKNEEKTQITKVFTLTDEGMKEVKTLDEKGDNVMYLNGSLYFNNFGLTKVDLKTNETQNIPLEINFDQLSTLNDESFLAYKNGEIYIYSYDLNLIYSYDLLKRVNNLVGKNTRYILTKDHFIAIYPKSRIEIFNLEREDFIFE
jgi:hypothetical protein